MKLNLQFKLLLNILNKMKIKIRQVTVNLNNYHSPLVRRLRTIRKMQNIHGAFSLITIMRRSVIMKGLKIFMMVKMYIVVEKIMTQLRFSLLMVKLQGKRETK